MNYDESLQWLYDLQYIGIKLGLDNTRALLAELGDPHERLKIIHVAGTNGKGSTTATICALLDALGHSYGSYTSPHLAAYNERVR